MQKLSRIKIICIVFDRFLGSSNLGSLFQVRYFYGNNHLCYKQVENTEVTTNDVGSSDLISIEAKKSETSPFVQNDAVVNNSLVDIQVEKPDIRILFPANVRFWPDFSFEKC